MPSPDGLCLGVDKKDIGRFAGSRDSRSRSLIHPSAWKDNSPKFALWALCELRLEGFYKVRIGLQ